MSTSATALRRRSTLASVPTTSTSKPGTPRSRISSSVWVTPCMPPTASATSATRGRSPSRWTSLPFSRPRKAAAGAYGMAATQASKRPAAAAPRSLSRDWTRDPPSPATWPAPAPARVVVATRTPSTARASLRSWARRARRKRSAWLKSSCWSSASSSRPPTRSSTASSQARNSARASSGARSAPIAPLRTSPSRMRRSTMVSTARGSTAWSPSPRPSARTARAMALCAHFAALPWSPRAAARPARTWARYSCQVCATGVSVKVRPTSTPAWSSEPPTPVPPWVSM